MNIFDANRIFEAIYRENNPDRSKTLQAWQERAQAVRLAILQLKQDHQEAAKPFREKYLPDVADAMSRELWESAETAIHDRLAVLRDDLQDVIAGKRQQFERIALSTPDETTLRLLQTVALRDDLSESEVARLAENMADNFQALRALRSVARKSGIDVPAPPTPESFEAAICAAENFCLECLNSIQKSANEFTYNERCFYDYTGAGLPQSLFDRLDSCLYAAVQQDESASE